MAVSRRVIGAAVCLTATWWAPYPVSMMIFATTRSPAECFATIQTRVPFSNRYAPAACVDWRYCGADHDNSYLCGADVIKAMCPNVALYTNPGSCGGYPVNDQCVAEMNERAAPGDPSRPFPTAADAIKWVLDNCLSRQETENDTAKTGD